MLEEIKYSRKYFKFENLNLVLFDPGSAEVWQPETRESFENIRLWILNRG